MSTLGCRRTARARLAVATAATAAALTAGCAAQPQAGDSTGDPGTLTVRATDEECVVSASTVAAGTLTFQVSNEGTEVTELYLLARDSSRIVGEVENIGPGLTRTLVVSAVAGDYEIACKPGMTGEGIRAPLTVTGGEEADGRGREAGGTAQQAAVDRAVQRYTAYVRAESARLLRSTEGFLGAYLAGEDDRARALYPRARTHWERIEPVAESFGDLDPRMDLREADLEPGQRWTGWHRIEKDLWPPSAYGTLGTAQRRTYAHDLLASTRTLDERVQGLELTLDQVANGSTALLEEVATGKVTGEEERWSHTDLWDFQANVDGARVAYREVRAILEGSDPALATTLDRRFAGLQALLDEHRAGSGFVSYDQLGPADVAGLADAVNALAEPLSRLTAAVLG
jgi:iron uptake system component EfeO